MTLARITLRYLWRRRLVTLLHLSLLALAVSAVTLVVLTSEQLEHRISHDVRGIDLVVGPKGSQTQMILSAVYGVELPIGEVRWSAAQEIVQHAGAANVIPIALGDTYKGFRIVATSHDYVSHYGAEVSRGRLWREPMEAVVGADVYARFKLPLDSALFASHGSSPGAGEFHGSPYRVVGVLAHTGSVIDRSVVTDLQSFWTLHAPPSAPPEGELVSEPPLDEGKTVSALLVRFHGDGAASDLTHYLAGYDELQAASPGKESAPLFGTISVGIEFMRAFATVLTVTAALSILVALYHGFNERRYDLAVMRTLGATRSDVMALLLCEGVVLALIGLLLGLALGHVLTSLLGFALQKAGQFSVTGWIWHPTELWIVWLTLLLGFVTAWIPAWRAHEVDIAGTLARG